MRRAPIWPPHFFPLFIIISARRAVPEFGLRIFLNKIYSKKIFGAAGAENGLRIFFRIFFISARRAVPNFGLRIFFPHFFITKQSIVIVN